MNQQVGDGEEVSQRSNYGRSIDEAKSLIKQLEAFKNSPTNESAATTANENDPSALEKNAKNDVNIDST